MKYIWKFVISVHNDIKDMPAFGKLLLGTMAVLLLMGVIL